MYIAVNAVNGAFLGSSNIADEMVTVAARSSIPAHVCNDEGEIVWDAWEPQADYATQLMERRARLMDAWMERVAEAQAAHSALTFWSAGVVIDSKGTLRMIAFAPNSWDQLWELECAEDGKVVFTEAT